MSQLFLCKIVVVIFFFFFFFFTWIMYKSRNVFSQKNGKKINKKQINKQKEKIYVRKSTMFDLRKNLIFDMLQQCGLHRPLTAKLCWCLFSSVSHVSDRLELHNNNWASGSKHPGPSESDVYSDVIQEAQSNDLLHTARLLMRLDTPLHDNNARGTKYAVYYVSVVTHRVFENKNMAALTLFWN